MVMSKAELMRKLEAAIDAATRDRMYGHIDVEFVDGVPMYLRKAEQEKLTLGNRKEVIQYANHQKANP